MFAVACHCLRLPEGLEDVSKVPSVVAELLRRGWTEEEVKAALGENLLRVMREVEKVRNECMHIHISTVHFIYFTVFDSD